MDWGSDCPSPPPNERYQRGEKNRAREKDRETLEERERDQGTSFGDHNFRIYQMKQYVTFTSYKQRYVTNLCSSKLL